MQRPDIQLKPARNAAPQWSARGFTLVELLVVLAIVGVLFSLIGVAVMSGINTARIASTKGTLVKIQGLLQHRIDALTIKPLEAELVSSMKQRFGNIRRAEVMARKFQFRQAFPQTWNEIELYYPSLLVGQTYPAAGARYPRSESAEVLYFILTKANVLGYAPEGVDVFTSNEVKDTDTTPNGAPELIDAWGQPLRFYRWPTRLVRGGPYTASINMNEVAIARTLMPALPTTALDLANDAEDKLGLLKVNANWKPPFPTYQLPVDQIAYYENGLAPAPTSSVASPFYQMGRFHTLETASLPLVVSGGPDGFTGLYEPSDFSNFGYLAQRDPTLTNNVYDNLTNFNTRSGGK